MSGHKFQKLRGNNPKFDARKISPMTIIATGQKTRLGMHPPGHKLHNCAAWK
jgi:hypothetical protein